MTKEEIRKQYEEIAFRYMENDDEECLYEVSKLSRRFLEQGLGPEDVLDMHFQLMTDILNRTNIGVRRQSAQNLSLLLLEAMMVYSQTHQEVQNVLAELKKKNEELDAANKELERSRDELRQKTAQLIQTEKMSALGELAAAVAHEINQPLNAIRIICDDVKRDVEKDRIDLPYLKESVHDVVAEVRKMTEIIDHMRIFTRRTEGVIRERIEIRSPVEGVFRLLGQQLRIHGIEVTRDLQKDLYILGDPVRLEQVVMNLVTNARDAVKDNPKEQAKKISVRAYLEQGDEGRGDTVVLEFEDNGKGVPEDLCDRIFEPFFTQKMPGQGTGLGLSVTKEIIEDHGGSIEVRSAQGKGTVFRVALPASPNGNGI